MTGASVKGLLRGRLSLARVVWQLWQTQPYMSVRRHLDDILALLQDPPKHAQRHPNGCASLPMSDFPAGIADKAPAAEPSSVVMVLRNWAMYLILCQRLKHRPKGAVSYIYVHHVGAGLMSELIPNYQSAEPSRWTLLRMPFEYQVKLSRVFWLTTSSGMGRRFGALAARTRVLSGWQVPA